MEKCKSEQLEKFQDVLQSGPMMKRRDLCVHCRLPMHPSPENNGRTPLTATLSPESN